MREYHLLQLEIAKAPGDRRRIMPLVSAHHRAILDIGCGAGQTLIASDLAAGVKAVGVDLDSDGLVLGKELTNAVHFACAKGEALPFKDECFDLVISRVALPYMHLERALAEMHRVLQPGGDLWIVLHSFNMFVKAFVRHLARFEFRGALSACFVLFNGATLHLFGKQFPIPPKCERYESCQSSRSITRALHVAGFDDVRVRHDRFFVVTARKVSTD